MNNVGVTRADGVVRRPVRFNIGLENNKFNAKTVVSFLQVFCDVDSWHVCDGEYNGHPERTLVVVGLAYRPQEVFDKWVVSTAGVCTQDCIAYKYGGKGYLTYAHEYEGERFDFDERYFI